jgi:hypothetical protein
MQSCGYICVTREEVLEHFPKFEMTELFIRFGTFLFFFILFGKFRLCSKKHFMEYFPKFGMTELFILFGTF